MKKFRLLKIFVNPWPLAGSIGTMLLKLGIACYIYTYFFSINLFLFIGVIIFFLMKKFRNYILSLNYFVVFDIYIFFMKKFRLLKIFVNPWPLAGSIGAMLLKLGIACYIYTYFSSINLFLFIGVIIFFLMKKFRNYFILFVLFFLNTNGVVFDIDYEFDVEPPKRKVKKEKKVVNLEIESKYFKNDLFNYDYGEKKIDFYEGFLDKNLIIQIEYDLKKIEIDAVLEEVGIVLLVKFNECFLVKTMKDEVYIFETLSILDNKKTALFDNIPLVNMDPETRKCEIIKWSLIVDEKFKKIYKWVGVDFDPIGIKSSYMDFNKHFNISKFSLKCSDFKIYGFDEEIDEINIKLVTKSRGQSKRKREPEMIKLQVIFFTDIILLWNKNKCFIVRMSEQYMDSECHLELVKLFLKKKWSSSFVTELYE